ncbi:glutathione S-transferase family protein [Aurantiacibacter sp. MUD11]|uniref:glutathione S-transferase family protein n=1 Tax=Aurantiacibacter sp. MUD11 TaxID=3003265 RepID=UPI0022AB0F9A|nr:glutathione S-transferase family protein [Aurantiacibacter sp. MUD11]WAT18824.1 glutathione S-transferase family protein [Aurantiacibacter sp. MUD11]
MLTIYGFPTSPYVRKALLVAEEKGLDYELVPATPHKPTPEFLSASPFRMMPAMEEDGFALADSTAMALYLDAKYPEPKLLPDDPKARGLAMMFDEFADTMLADSARAVGFNRYIGPTLLGITGDLDAADAAEERAHPLLDWLEEQIGDGWLTGGDYSLGDIAVSCCLRTLAYGMDVATRPRTSAWLERVHARPAWQAVAAKEAEMFAAAEGSGEHQQG